MRTAQRSPADAHPDRKSESEDPQRDKRAEQLLRSLDVAPEDTPVVIWHGEKVLRNPTNAELARIVGLPVPDSVPDAAKDVCNLVVVGAGPAGLAASV
ncbi:hypothetical protein RW1_005_01120 [Rhodococcus wratislaviensis NBRC 100605]|uniref:Uncharacterized protein n=1 Tax=Rhodococcus wratislaviensis NBRC 100605 TaxID=1219028 RepID=X0PKT1_RHOWR|nr:hypothetical protein RW1_005_01120 [Rhodococcus wratislaviensis NBRC 100605]